MSRVMNMMPVALPRFMGATAAKKQKQASDPQVALSSHNWGSYSAAHQSNHLLQDDPLDFDLLAQYLLDDGTASGVSDWGADIPIVATTTSEQTVNAHDGSYVNPVTVQPPVQTAPAPTPYAPPQQTVIPRASAAAPVTPLMPANYAAAPVTTTTTVPLHPAPQSIAPSGPIPSPAPPILSNPHKRQRQAYAPNSGPPSFTPSFPQKGGRPKSQAQIDRRRERNRILARRTRLRKKFFFESLQKDVMDLQQENMVLKEIVRSRINPTDSKAILDSCKANELLPSCVLEQCGDMSNLDRQDFNLMQSIQKSQQCFVITDPSLQDNPIVYASQDFLSLTGYSRDEVLGRNCRFLQGVDTSQQKVKQIREAISTGSDVTVTFINYTADGTPFWNKLFIAALRDAQNNIVNFIGVSVKVAGPEQGDPEEGKQLFPDSEEGTPDANNLIPNGTTEPSETPTTPKTEQQ